MSDVRPEEGWYLLSGGRLLELLTRVAEGESPRSVLEDEDASDISFAKEFVFAEDIEGMERD